MSSSHITSLSKRSTRLLSWWVKERVYAASSTCQSSFSIYVLTATSIPASKSGPSLLGIVTFASHRNYVPITMASKDHIVPYSLFYSKASNLQLPFCWLVYQAERRTHAQDLDLLIVIFSVYYVELWKLNWKINKWTKSSTIDFLTNGINYFVNT